MHHSWFNDMIKTKKINFLSIIVIFIFISCSKIEKQQEKPLKKVSINELKLGKPHKFDEEYTRKYME